MSGAPAPDGGDRVTRWTSAQWDQLIYGCFAAGQGGFVRETNKKASQGMRDTGTPPKKSVRCCKCVRLFRIVYLNKVDTV